MRFDHKDRPFLQTRDSNIELCESTFMAVVHRCANRAIEDMLNGQAMNPVLASWSNVSERGVPGWETFKIRKHFEDCRGSSVDDEFGGIACFD